MIPYFKDPQPLSMVRGRTAAWGLKLKDSAGSPLKLEEGQKLLFGVKADEDDTECVIKKMLSHAVDGDYYLELQPSDTEKLSCGRYYYDVSLQEGDTVLYTVIEASSFYIKHNVTKLGDGA